jgi:hypothetical protein
MIVKKWSTWPHGTKCFYHCPISGTSAPGSCYSSPATYVAFPSGSESLSRSLSVFDLNSLNKGSKAALDCDTDSYRYFGAETLLY